MFTPAGIIRRFRKPVQLDQCGNDVRVNSLAGDDVPLPMLLFREERSSIKKTQSMAISSVTASEVRTALLLRDEIALLDVRHEAVFATGHPLFAANMAAERIALEAETRLPRKDVPIVGL